MRVTMNGVPLEVDPSSIRVGTVCLLPDEHAASLFMERVFPHCPSVFVVSADGAFPRDEELRAHVIEAMAEDRELAVVIFGFDSRARVRLCSERVLVMDELLLSRFQAGAGPDTATIALDARGIGLLVQRFSDQWAYLERAQNYAFEYRNDLRWEVERFDWTIDLITGRGGRCD